MKKFVLVFVLILVFALSACNNMAQNFENSSSSQGFSSFQNENQGGQNSQGNSSSGGANSSNEEQNSASNEGANTSSSINTSSSNSSSQGQSSSYSSSISVSTNIPSSVESVLNTAISETVLMPTGIVEHDYIIFPRVSKTNLVYMTFESHDTSIIDNEGRVYQGSSQKQVTVSGYFSFDGYTKKKDYTLTVAPKKEESVKITKNDARIKKIVEVNSVSALKTAVSSLSAGDCILLKSGTYSGFNSKIEASGTEQNPIFILSEVDGGAVFTGSTYFDCRGNNVIISGLKFANGSPANSRGAVSFLGDDCRLTNCLFDSFYESSVDEKWVSLSGKRAEVDHNEFVGKSAPGALLTIWREDDSSQFHHIHHNLFKDFPAGDANGFETIRVGDSTMSQSDAYCLIENNVFSSCNGEIEIISVKSGRNMVRNNTFIECQGHLTFRHGKNNYAYSNAFLCNEVSNSGGIRAYDGGHVIKNNYVYGQRSTSNTRAGFILHSGENEVGDIPKINAGWTAYNCLVENNTAVNCQQSFMFCKKYTYATKDIVLKNNVASNSSCAGFRVNIEPRNLQSSGNLVYASSVYTSNTTFSNLSGLEVKAYFLPTISQFGCYEYSGCGSSGVKVLTEQNVGNY